MPKPEVEVINWIDEEARKTWLGYALIHLLSATGQPFKPSPDPTTMQVECKIDGVTVSLRELVDHISKDFDRQVAYAARELVKERYAKIDDYLYRLKTNMENEFPELKDED